MRLTSIGLIILVAFLAFAPAFAQDTAPIPDNVDTSGITDDQVNAIANQLYCPVCENIPLATCGTAACADWREEIRGMLATGMVGEDIIDNFVVRFGDRVVSTPRNPIIAAISIITPWLVLVIAAGFALYQLMQWSQKRRLIPENEVSNMPSPEKRNRYIEQLEKDLAGK